MLKHPVDSPDATSNDRNDYIFQKPIWRTTYELLYSSAACGTQAETQQYYCCGTITIKYSTEEANGSVTRADQ